MASAAETRSDLDALADEWEELAERAGATPFTRPGWYLPWWRAWGSGEPEFVVLRRDGRLAAVAPLRRRGGALESMTNWHTVEFGLLAEDERARVDLARAIFAKRPRRATLQFLTEGETDIRALRDAAVAARYRTLARTLERSPFVPIEGTWESYQAGRDRHLVTEARRRRKRLEERGRVSFELADGRTRLDTLLEEGFRIEASGWKAEQGTAIVSEPATRGFYTELARLSAAAGTLRLAFLRLDDQPLAFQYLIEDAGILYFLKGGFDTDFRSFAPGTLLVEETLSHAFRKGLKSFEFLGFDEPFKLEWTDQVRERRLLQAFAPTPAGLVDWSVHAYGRPIAKRLLALRRR